MTNAGGTTCTLCSGLTEEAILSPGQLLVSPAQRNSFVSPFGFHLFSMQDPCDLLSREGEKPRDFVVRVTQESFIRKLVEVKRSLRAREAGELRPGSGSLMLNAHSLLCGRAWGKKAVMTAPLF